MVPVITWCQLVLEFWVTESKQFVYTHTSIYSKVILFTPGRCGRVVSASTCQAGGLWFKSGILALLKHACGESDWLLCWPYTLAEVSHQRWISGNVYNICLCKVWIRLPTLALKPWGDVTRSLKQGHQWPQKWTCVQQKFFLKKKSNIIYWFSTYIIFHWLFEQITEQKTGNNVSKFTH